MIRFISIYIMCFFCVALFAQAPDTLWTKTFGPGEGRSVQQTTDGGYIITGPTDPYLGDVLFIKTNGNGDTLWTKTFGNINTGSWGNSVQQTSEGGYIIAGATNCLVSPIPGFSTSDAWLIKTDVSGNTLWNKTFGGTEIDWNEWYSVKQATDGGYIITGITGAGVCLIKTDASGDTLWTKTFGGNGGWAYSVQQTTDWGYVIAGTIFSGDDGSYDVWLIKTDSLGSIIWTKTYGGSLEAFGNSVQQTNDGGYIVVGHIGFIGSGSDIWLIKTDALGDTLWTKTFGGSGDDEGKSVIKTTDGGFIITGFTSSLTAGGSDVWLIKTDSSGDTLWTKTLGWSSNESGLSVQQAIDGGYIVTGFTRSFGEDYGVLLIKTTADVTDVKQDAEIIISDYSLYQNYPNPFNPSTTIKYSIPEKSIVTLKIYDQLGSEVETLVNGEKPVGTYELNWNAANLPSGVYFYQLKAESFIQTKKMILLK